MLDGRDHDHGRQDNAGKERDQRKQPRYRGEQNRNVHQYGNPASPAIIAIDDAGADIDAAGDAPEAGRDRIGEAQTRQKAVAGQPKIARAARKPDAEQRVDRGDDGEREPAGQDERRRLRQQGDDGGAVETRQHVIDRNAGGRHADDGAERGAKSHPYERIIDGGPSAESDQQRRHICADLACPPGHGKSQRGDHEAQRPHRAEIAEHVHEADVVIEPEHIAELHQEEQRRRHVLEARHDGMRRELDQRSESQQSE